MKKSLLLVCSTIVLFSCNKHELEPYSEVKIGNYSNMITTRYDTMLSLVYNFSPVSIDVDNDGISDFRIEYHDSRVTLPTTNYGFMSAQIISLDSNIYLSKVNKSDTTYVEYLSDTTSEHLKSFTTNYLCDKSSNKAEFCDVKQTEYPKTYYKDDIISVNESWESKGLVFVNIGDPVFAYYHDWYDRVNNTVWIYYQNYFIECHFSLPYNQDFYFGFKKIKGNESKVGWIKFRILREAGKPLIISETAIHQ